MGIYTSNRFVNESVQDHTSEIPANEAYNAAFGCAQILADCQRNDMALFESAIFSDMNELMAVHEGVEVVNENAFTNVIKKLVEMFKKLVAKIKGIFAAFLAKLAGAFKNGKELVKKYEKQIIKYSNWKDLKIKGIRKPKSGHENIKATLDSVFSIESVKTAYKVPGFPDLSDTADWTHIPGFGSIKAVKEAEASELKLALIKMYINGPSLSDYADVAEDVKEAIYEDADTIDGDDDIKSSSYFSAAWIKGVLQDEKWEKDVKKVADKLEKKINTIIDDLNKVEDNLAKFRTDKNNTTDERTNTGVSGGRSFKDDEGHHVDTSISAGRMNAEAAQKAIQCLQTIASNEQEVISKVTSLYLEEIKFATAQARKIWTAAAAWSSGVHKESVEYYNALGECAAEQFYTNMEALG